MIVRESSTLRAMYELTEDSYTGGGQFATGEALFEYGREMDFEQRQNMSYYVNYIQPIVNSTTDPVFVGSPERIYNDDPIISLFLENADNNRTSLEEVVHHATTYTNLIGNSFIIMDNFDSGDIPDNLQDVLDERKIPFIYTKECKDVFEYDTDIFGRLIDISFFYGDFIPDGYDEEVMLYKRFSQDEIEYFWIKKVKDEVTGEFISERVTLTLTNHDLGVVPVVYYNKNILPSPPTYYSMATLARAIYNTGSEIQDLQRSQSFSILLIPSTVGGAEPDDAIIISSHNALFYDSDATNQPDYISPDSNIMKTNQETMDKQINLLIQSADVLGTTALSNNNGTTSGIAYSYKFFGKTQKLLQSSDIANYLETELIKLLGLFLGVTIEYEVSYPNAFSPTFAENKEKLVALEGVANMDISDTITSTVYADITKIVGDVMGWTDEELDTALESITEVSQIV